MSPTKIICAEGGKLGKKTQVPLTKIMLSRGAVGVEFHHLWNRLLGPHIYTVKSSYHCRAAIQKIKQLRLYTFLLDFQRTSRVGGFYESPKILTRGVRCVHRGISNCRSEGSSCVSKLNLLNLC